MFGRDKFYQLSTEQSGLRLPKTLPQCLIGSGDGSGSNSDTDSTIPPGGVGQAGKPAQQSKPKKAVATKPKQQYIPGLNSADDPNVIVPANSKTVKYLPKEVPASLIEAFLSGAKQPISAIMEYAALKKLVCVFEEVAVECRSIVARFACRAKINGKPFPQGTGSTKKEAKTAAAKVAFSMLLGLEKEDVEDDEDAGSVHFDTLGRKIVFPKSESLDYDDDDSDTLSNASTAFSKMSLLRDTTFSPKVELPSTMEAGVTPLWDAPKHPVSLLTQYCGSKYLELKFTVSDYSTDIGFRAEAIVCEEPMGTAYALNKKEAKKKAAEAAIARLCPHFLSEEEKPDTAPVPAPKTTRLPSGVPLLLPTNEKAGVVRPAAHEDRSSAVVQLQEFCASNKIPLSLEVSDNPGPEGYEGRVMIFSDTIAISVADMKKDAKRLVAESALAKLQASVQPKKSKGLEKLPFFDRMGILSHKHFTQLLAPTGEKASIHKYMAAFIVQRGEDDVGEVVAMGTGNGSISGGNRAPNGRVLNDCHAVVIAKRGLMKYFYTELKAYYEGNVVTSIFEAQLNSPLLKLKDYLTINLYMSRAPCGDVAFYTTKPDAPLTSKDMEVMAQGVHYPSFPDEVVGFTSVKHEQGFGVTLACEQPAKWGDMSCSDKILKWNVIGLQGSVFSHFLSPIYLNSLTLGSLYDHGHLTRGICCRIDASLSDSLPAGYRLNHPHVGRVTDVNPALAEDTICLDSINWSLGDEMIEIVNSVTGKSCDRSPFLTGPACASRLSKAGFLFRFRDIARLAKKQKLQQLAKYSDVKQASVEYQQAKNALITHTESTGFGFWVRKPPGLEHFTK